MRRILNILLLLFISMLFSGCENLTEKKITKTRAPSNEMLLIQGKWEILNYKFLSDNVNSKEKLSSMIGSTIEISNNSIQVSKEKHNNCSFKLKIVKEDYVISYEANYKVKNLEFNKSSVEVFSVINENNIIMEFFRGDKEKSYIFYKGGLFEVKFAGDIIEEYQNKVNNKLEDEPQVHISNDNYNEPIGLYLGIKSIDEDGSNDSINKERYKTIFISFRNGKLISREKKDEIVVPRMSGIWTINKSRSQVDGHIEEHFNAKAIEPKIIEYNKNNMKQYNTDIYRSIKFVCNNYIATEVYSGKLFKGDYNNFEVIPIDNINCELPVNIGDIFSIEGNNLFENEYKKNIKNISKDELKNYNQNINYNNFSVERYNGKWNIIGKISPEYNIEGKGYDYPINLRLNKKLINYDLLSIPWKTLKRKIPLLEDAYISPNNRIAIIVTNGKLLIYEIKDGELKDSPLGNISLNCCDKIIMAEWCIGDYYVNRWEKPFLD